jgi:hypothetical protein
VSASLNAHQALLEALRGELKVDMKEVYLILCSSPSEEEEAVQQYQYLEV